MNILKYTLAAIVVLLLINGIRQFLGGSATEAPDSSAEPAAAGPVVATAKDPCKPQPAIYRPTFTDGVTDRVPRNQLVSYGPETERLLFYTEVIGAAGRKITHKWFVGDTAIGSHETDVQADRWSTWSRQEIKDAGAPDIRVEVYAETCLIGQATIVAGGEQLTQVEQGATGGWMRPRQAIEVLLAKPAIDSAAAANRNPFVDDLTDSGDTLLLAAIRAGNTDEALMLIERNTDVEAPQGIYGNEVNAWYGRRYRNADPFLRGPDGASPIQLAHDMGNDVVVEALIASAITPYRLVSRNKKYGTFDDSTLAAMLVGDNGFMRFDDGDTPLLRAVRTGNERAVLTMLRLPGWNDQAGPYSPPVDIYAYDARGKQALTVAREQGNYASERFLLLAMTRKEPGWAVTRSTFTTGMAASEPADCRKTAFTDEQPIHYFTELTDMDGKPIVHEWRRDRQPVHRDEFTVTGRRWSGYSSHDLTPADAGSWDVRVLSDSGEELRVDRLSYQELTDYSRRNRAKMNAPCNMGGAAFIALVKAQAAVDDLAYLVDKGMELNSRNSVGEVVFKQAINDANIRLLGWLFERGFDVNGYADGAYTPLMIAAKNGSEALALYLITKGADVQFGNYRDGLSALHVAVIERNAEMAGLLLDNGAAANIQTDNGYTPLHRTIANCDQRTTLVLLEHGADPGMRNKAGEAPRDRVAQCANRESWDSRLPALAGLYAE